jgi:crotonobetainyl-CoA:carnitine CoA-transferase CaiB-like acyl-CoA transferase
VLIEGFRPGVAARLGIGYEELARDNPGLIYLSVSGFGQSGPYSRRPGSDSVAQAFSGLVSINLGADGTPHRVGTTISDVVTGVYAFQAVSTTLFARTQMQEIFLTRADGSLAHAAARRRHHCGTDPQSGRMAAQRPCRRDQGRGVPGHAGRRPGLHTADAGHCQPVRGFAMPGAGYRTG